MTDGSGNRSQPQDRAAVEQAVQDLVLAVVRRRTPGGASVVLEGAAGIGKTFLARQVIEAVPPGTAMILRVAGEPGRRADPFAGLGPLLDGQPGRAARAAAPSAAPAAAPSAAPSGSAASDRGDPAAAAFDRVDELCGHGPVVLCAEDAHNLDSATLTVLRRLVWASRSLHLAVLVTTRPDPSREPLAMLISQAQVRLRLPPMSRMTVERLVYDRTGRWPGPRLRQVLGLAAGNPLFVTELLRAYQDADALATSGQDSVEARFELDLHGTGLEEVIRGHLAQLDQPTRDVLGVLAVWGTDISAGDLASLLPGPADGLDGLLERAMASGLVRRDPDGTFAFSHDLFREVTYGELAEPRRRAAHRRVAEILAAAGYRPSLVADHLLRAAGTDGDQSLAAALHEAVEDTRGYAPEVTADLLDDAAALAGADLPDKLLLDHVDALFHQGRGNAAETLIRERIMSVADPSVAAQMQLILIRSLTNRADLGTVLAVMDRTVAIAGLPDPTRRQLEGSRAFLLAQAGQPPAAAELDAMMARFTAAGDKDAQANLLATFALSAFLSGRADRALEFLRTRGDLVPDPGSLRSRSSTLALPAVLELSVSGPAAAQAALDRARRLSAERHAEWVDPFLGFVAGGIALVAGDWDGAVAELDAALEGAEETGTGWISTGVGMRSYIDAHRGSTAAARARLESFRYRGLPLQYGHDRPGWAELAVLEAEGAVREAGTLARTLWAGVRAHPGRWAADLAPDVTRVAITGMDRRLAGQVSDDVAAVCPPEVASLVHGMLGADPDMIEASATELAEAGRLTAEAFAREELAVAAATAGDRGRAAAALDVALAGYQRMGAVPDRDRALGRLRALGLRRGSREAHRDTDFGWASLTATEQRITALVRDGLTNREIGTRLFVSPRTVQTHVSHILQKTGLRSRVEVARAAPA
jgi:DNA-binding CsgD family transcriptional regulator